MRLFVQTNLNCAHAVHILWSCKLSVVVQQPAESPTKNACTHGTAVFQARVSITWLTLAEYAAISSLSDHVKIICLVCLSFRRIFISAYRLTEIFLADTHSTYSNCMSDHRISHVAVQEQVFKVLHWPHFQCFQAAPAVDCDCLAPFLGLK